MPTREQAAELITSALAQAGAIDNIMSADAFAARLATALEALGMLQYADPDDAPRLTKEFFDRAKVEHGTAPIADTGAKAPATDDAPWATQRQRT